MKKIIGIAVIVVIAAGLAGGISIYYLAFKDNISLTNNQNNYINIPTDANYHDVLKILKEKELLINTKTFDWIAHKKNYPNMINPGHYPVKSDMSNNELINMLRAGEQKPVKVVFNNIRTKKEMAKVISQQIEADSASLIQYMENNEFLSKYDFDKKTILGMFIPNTYEFFWNTGAKGFITRMHREYKRFWNKKRETRLEKIDLTKKEGSTLASIIDEETEKKDEMPTIAGVYINRLNRGIPLQADPTIKFALNDFSMRRVLKKHLEVDSPYNTYKNRGLPPGPIVIPSIAAIESILYYEDHKYLYFCARDDFSGYHVFAKTLQQHLQNARKYQSALSKNKIYK